jgi:hypothetical protein
MQDSNPANALAVPFANASTRVESGSSACHISQLPLRSTSLLSRALIEGTGAALAFGQTLTLPRVIAACVCGWAGQGWKLLGSLRVYRHKELGCETQINKSSVLAIDGARTLGVRLQAVLCDDGQSGHSLPGCEPRKMP